MLSVVLTNLSECISFSEKAINRGAALYLPIFQNVYPSHSGCGKEHAGCTYPSFRMYIHLEAKNNNKNGSCTYPSFKMYIHRDVRTILNNRHLLNVRAILFLLQNI